jgi:hypothetical protein
MEGKEISEVIKNNNISKATFYNRVLPRLKRLGLIRIKRQTEYGNEKKYRHMKIEISKTFGNYLLKIADSWLAHVDDLKEQRQRKTREQEKNTDNI